MCVGDKKQKLLLTTRMCTQLATHICDNVYNSYVHTGLKYISCQVAVSEHLAHSVCHGGPMIESEQICAPLQILISGDTLEFQKLPPGSLSQRHCGSTAKPL